MVQCRTGTSPQLRRPATHCIIHNCLGRTGTVESKLSSGRQIYDTIWRLWRNGQEVFVTMRIFQPQAGIKVWRTKEMDGVGQSGNISNVGCAHTPGEHPK